MQRFTQLYLEMDSTTRTSEKRAMLANYFREAPPIDSAWAVYLLSGRKLGKAVSSRLLRDWTSEVSGHPLWLVEECYHIVGDLSETLSLLVPTLIQNQSPPPLHEIISQHLRPLAKMDESQKRKSILQTWSLLDADQRLVFHKLLSGNFRVGASRQLMIRALADVAQVEAAVIAHRLAGTWEPSEKSMLRLLSSEDSTPSDAMLPYPFMLAHAFTDAVETFEPLSNWLIEWKWDGIRSQVIRRDGIRLWSRGDEDVTGAFPEIAQAGALLQRGTVIDGEIVAWDEPKNLPLPFTSLQRRLNRKHVELSLWPDVPVRFVAFDLLEMNSRDMRAQPLSERRAMLKALLANAHLSSIIEISQPMDCVNCDSINTTVLQSRDLRVEGVMLKRLDSKYEAGRPTGLWWKLKVQPYTVDAVLIAAEPGRGRRAGLLTDYTFGVWDKTGVLVPIAKAYSGLTDLEIKEVDRFARANTTERFGPVRVIKPEMVFELGFEAIQKSDRHKSGLAVRFPRMLRMRSDKKPADADTLETLQKLLAASEVPR